jgi:hypothetical protein
MSLESPASVLYDDNGIALAVSGGMVVPISTSALLFAGMTITGTASVARMTSDGTVFVTGALSTTPTV